MLEERDKLRTALSLVAVGMLLTGGISGYTGTATANHECEFSDSLTFAIVDSFKNAGEPGTNDNCEVFHGRETVNTTGTDSQQIKLDIYTTSQSVKSQSDIYNATLNNYLQDTEEVALMVGKNAYIKALNNGSSKSAATTKAKAAINDYYTVKQLNLIESWNSSVNHLEYVDQVAANESISDFYIYMDATNNGTPIEEAINFSNPMGAPTTASVTTVNNTNKNIRTILTEGGEGDGYFTYTHSIDPDEIYGVYVSPPSDSYDKLQFLNTSSTNEWKSRYNEIETQAANARAEVDTFANTTYDQYQQGRINSSDLLDPLTISRYYSPSGNFSNWALSNARLLGLATPETLDKTGKFSISYNGVNYEGMLLSDSSPNGGFASGLTYNATELSGTQYIATSSGLIELKGEFTINEITSRDGESLDSVEYEQPNYTASNISEYESLLQNLTEDREQLEAREIEILQSGSGSTSDSGSNPFGFLSGSTYGIPNWAIMVLGGGLILIGSRSA